jgi:hypothetical protein
VVALALPDPSVFSIVVAQTTTTVAQTTTTTAPGPVIDIRGPGAVALVVAVGLAFALLWAVPFWVDARRAYRLRERAVDLIGGKLLDAARKDGLSIAELRELLSTVGEPATGQRGLSRALMAFTIITVIGVALVALLLSSSGDAVDLRKTVITSLLTLLGTIVGFYFGTRAAETASEASTPEPARPAPPAGAGGTPDSTQAPVPDGPAVPPVDEAAVPPAGGDPEEMLEAGLQDLDGGEVAALNEQVAAEQGEPEETEVGDDEPLHEDDLLSEGEADDEPPEGGPAEPPEGGPEGEKGSG